MSTARMNQNRIRINSDMGEGIGLHSFGFDAELMPLIDAANIACGFHAGDPAIMDATVRLAVEHGVAIGAHPGLPDLVGFGRRPMTMSPDEVEQIVRYQTGALKAFLDAHDAPLSHIKPHGSLYGMVARDAELMRAVVRVARTYGAAVYGMAGTAHQQVAEAEGVEFVPELYVDLDYDEEGRLVILRRPIPKHPDEVAERIRHALATGQVRTTAGNEIEVPFASICVHSDTEGCVEIARAARTAVDTAAERVDD